MQLTITARAGVDSVAREGDFETKDDPKRLAAEAVRL